MAKLLTGRGPTVITPPVLPPVVPEPVVIGRAKYPAGNVSTKRPGQSQSYNIPWTNVSRWEPLWSQMGASYPDVPRGVMEAIAIIETGASHYTTDKTTGKQSEVRVRPGDSYDQWPAVGMMQVKPHYHQARVPDADPYTVPGNVRLAYALVDEGIKATGSWEKSITRPGGYFPGDDSATSTTQGAYIATIKSILGELSAVRDPVVINPAPALEPLEAIFGKGNFPRIILNFGEDGGVGYAYAVGHGTSRESQHPGADIDVPFGTKFYAPAPGKILCIGENGTGVWGQGCGFFRDTGNGGTTAPSIGVGNITLLCDSGHKIVFGHSRTCNFKPGDRVKAGDWLGTTGGMLGPHMHLEVAIDGPDKVSASERNRGLTYWIVNPLPAIKIAMGQPGVITTPIAPITNIIWEGTTNFHDRQGQAPISIFYHVTDDLKFSNVKSWFQNPTSQASAHFVVDRDGSKHQFVVSGKAAWTNGDVKSPRTDIKWINEAIRSGRNFNDFTLNIECVGKPGNFFPTAQIDSVIEISRYYVASYPGIKLNRGHFCRHADVNSVDRPYCPSNSFPLKEIMQECGADPAILNP